MAKMSSERAFRDLSRPTGRRSSSANVFGWNPGKPLGHGELRLSQGREPWRKGACGYYCREEGGVFYVQDRKLQLTGVGESYPEAIGDLRNQARTLPTAVEKQPWRR